MRFVIALLALCVTAVPLAALSTSQGALKLEVMTDQLDVPWGFGFLPDGSVLITEVDGRLLHLSDGDLRQVAGVGKVANKGQGGLLDVMIPRDFAQTREVFFSFAKKQGRHAGTAVARARLNADATQLSDWRVIYEMKRGSTGGRHFGSRLVEAQDGTVFVTIGERGDRPSAQDLSRANGSVLRITRAGSIPPDNPFVGQAGALPEIWSYGHRNPQGAGLDGQGALWVSEHGARGGDEVNLVRRGANYGWPIISYGVHYNGDKIGEGTAKPGMQQPVHYWDPSIAPSGLMVYSGKLWPDWRGDIFVGSLKFDYISRLSGPPLREVEQIAADQTARVRDIREAPDGSIWFLAVGDGALYRLSP